MAKTPNVAAVRPPKIIRGKRGTQVPTELLNVFTEVMTTTDEDDHPSWASDQVEYPSRAKANAQAMKIRKALVNEDDYPYTESKSIQSRVWNAGDINDKGEEMGPFYFALAERPAE
jgi:hypothetical protein